MAKRFTRNVKDVKDVTTFGINHTTQNDLINDDKNVFVHQKGKFEKITHQIDTLSSNGSVTIGEKDDKDNVHLSVYTGYVDEITSIDESLIVGEKTNGAVNLEVDYAPIDEKIQVANSQLETQLMQVIELEEKNRTEADTQLATNLATEVADRKLADNAIQTQIDNLRPVSNNTYLIDMTSKNSNDKIIVTFQSNLLIEAETISELFDELSEDYVIELSGDIFDKTNNNHIITPLYLLKDIGGLKLFTIDNYQLGTILSDDAYEFRLLKLNL